MADKHLITRRDALRISAGIVAFLAVPVWARPQAAKKPIFDVRDFGATGDGTTLDTNAIQRAINEASVAGKGAQVLLRGGKRYLIGALQLKGGIDFHLADDAELLVSADPTHYAGEAAITALNAHGIRITGTGTINGRSSEFMEKYDEKDEWWIPKAFRPRLLALTGCNDLELRDVTFLQAPLT